MQHEPEVVAVNLIWKDRHSVERVESRSDTLHSAEDQ